MKPGMTVVRKQQVKERWFWLCMTAGDSPTSATLAGEESLPGQGCREWATYVSISPDAAHTEHGHYFVNYSNAVQDYQTRLNSI